MNVFNVSRAFVALIVAIVFGSFFPAAHAEQSWEPIIINYDPSPVKGPLAPATGTVYQPQPCPASGCPLGVMPPDDVVPTPAAARIYAVITGVSDCDEGKCLSVQHAGFGENGALIPDSSSNVLVPLNPGNYSERRDLIETALRTVYFGPNYSGAVYIDFPADDPAIGVLLQ